ncbi:MAG TPA: c-type cytochrome [Bryobacteraceae bacterium]|nr:c-type cytochrome [Bryobacteraceae bacterium]
MEIRKLLFAAAVAGIVFAAPRSGFAQGSAPAAPVRRFGTFVPGEQRPPEDPAQVAHGKALFGVNCAGCHGVDLRGGDLGGPNLLRSQVTLSDKKGELILPIIQGARRDGGMPAIPLSPEDGLAVAAYIRSVVAMIGSQGRPPSIGEEAPSILVGNAAAGKIYFEAKCANCHSVTGDLQGIAAKYSDPKTLQTVWVAGGRRHWGPPTSASMRRIPAVTVTLASGERVEGRLVRIDDFLVSVGMADGSVRTYRREGDVPKVEVHDPMQTHRDLLAVYTDKDIHDVTAYLVTLK